MAQDRAARHGCWHGPVSGCPNQPCESKQTSDQCLSGPQRVVEAMYGVHLKCRSTMPVLPVLHLQARAVNSAPSLMRVANSSRLDCFPSCSQAYPHNR